MSKIATGKIFGIGLFRSGTSSLTYALRELGYKIIHGPRPALLPDMLDIIKDYDGATESPIAYQYKQLDKLYPNSKFIITVRSLESWLKSCEYFLKTAYDSGADDNIRTLLYGYKKFDKEKYTKAFIKHHKEVNEYFKGRELLIMNLPNGDGWEKLCYFLGKEIPNKPFPYEYTSKQVKEWWGNESKN